MHDIYKHEERSKEVKINSEPCVLCGTLELGQICGVQKHYNPINRGREGDIKEAIVPTLPCRMRIESFTSKLN